MGGHVQKTVHPVEKVHHLDISQQQLVVFEIGVILVILVLDKVEQRSSSANLASVVEVDFIEITAAIQTWL